MHKTLGITSYVYYKYR